MSNLTNPDRVHHLRRRWKPAKQRLQAERPDHPTNVRFHRACSWLQRVEQIEDGGDLDVALMCQWIALNALYGQWDEQRAEPQPDRACWRRFFDRMLDLDSDGRIIGVLEQHKRLVLAILDDSHLGQFFWRAPAPDRADQTTREKRQAATWYIEKRYGLILEHLLESIYLLRCQLFHGAATFNSRLNRKSLQRCRTMLNHLLLAVLLAWIDHGANEDWGPMCYPPVGGGG